MLKSVMRESEMSFKLQYEVRDGLYCLTECDLDTGEVHLLDEVGEEIAIAFDRASGTVHRHGNPDVIGTWASDAQRRMRCAEPNPAALAVVDCLHERGLIGSPLTANQIRDEGKRFADDLIVLAGKLPVEHLNKAINITGYAKKLPEILQGDCVSGVETERLRWRGVIQAATAEELRHIEVPLDSATLDDMRLDELFGEHWKDMESRLSYLLFRRCDGFDASIHDFETFERLREKMIEDKRVSMTFEQYAAWHARSSKDFVGELRMTEAAQVRLKEVVESLPSSWSEEDRFSQAMKRMKVHPHFRPAFEEAFLAIDCQSRFVP